MTGRAGRLAILALITVFGALAVYGYSWLVKGEIRDEYDGGGVISIRNAFANVGYEVVFDKIRLSNEFSRTYRIDSLPDIEQTPYVMFAVYSSGTGNLREDCINDARLAISVIKDGETVSRYRGLLVDWEGFGDSFDKRRTSYYWWDPERAHVSAVSRSLPPLAIEVAWKPGTNGCFDDDSGTLVIRAGGYK